MQDGPSTEEDFDALEQEQLKQAIALSLNQSHTPILSPAASSSKRKRSPSIEIIERPVPPNGATKAPKHSERRQMEIERLERQRAREVRGYPIGASKIKTMPPSNGPSRVATLSSLASTTSSSGSTSKSVSVSLSYKSFPSPAIRTTYNRNFPNDSNAVSFSDLVGNPKTLKSAIICAMCSEIDWVSAHFEAHHNLLLIQGTKPAPPQARLVQPPEWQGRPYHHMLIPPNRGHHQGVFHPKFFFFMHETFTRFVISTANLMGYDWNVIENICWIVDLPKPADKPLQVTMENSAFYRDMSRFLIGLEVPPLFWKDVLGRTDFSEIDSVARLVVSLAGEHRQGTPAYDHRHYGFPCLGRAVEELGVIPQKGEHFVLECQTSSVGEYEMAWLNQFCSSLPSSRFNSSQPPPLTIQFPTEKQVLKSKEGLEWAISFFCSERSWSFTPFGTHSLARQAKSKRDGLLMHVKMIVGSIKTKDEVEQVARKRAFLYLGSANFTAAAWGRDKPPLQKSTQRRLAVNNTELGIVFAVEAQNRLSLNAQIDDIVPWVRPSDKYEAGDKPFMMAKYGG